MLALLQTYVFLLAPKYKRVTQEGGGGGVGVGVGGAGGALGLLHRTAASTSSPLRPVRSEDQTSPLGDREEGRIVVRGKRVGSGSSVDGDGDGGYTESEEVRRSFWPWLLHSRMLLDLTLAIGLQPVYRVSLQ
jgi:hypothetical protein